jgi:predicted CoA-binding protein
MILTTPSQRRDLIGRARTIAMVGASANPLRPSYTVFSYLRRQPEFDVVPINPALEQIDGVKAYPSLAAYAAEHGPPDVVDVFRRPSELVGVVNEAIAVGAKTLWFQYGVINADAIALADTSGLHVVVDRCLKVEHARFRGGLSTSGLNSGIITSRWTPSGVRPARETEQ